MLTDFVHSLIGAETAAEIASCYFGAMRSLGFENVVYVVGPVDPRHGATRCDMFTNLPDGLMRKTDGDFTSAPWVKWGMSHSVSTTLAALGSTDRLRDPLQLTALLRDSGLAAARIIGLHDGVTRQRGVLFLNPFTGAVAKDLAPIWTRTQDEVMGHSWLLHLRVAAMRHHAPRHALTPRQREVLSWAAAGKTVAEIAMILGLTRATVEKHMRLARETLDANSTAQAVLKAHLSHQLDIGKKPPT
ncbi:helix-turn-helix transcriptional regulator [Paracoccus sp. (in: a-proteobacteria)]|uniref:helix-turn-helix transcriptional regulator n=1 Tax=Paracoccus sp. TaxID=267 RepID=UPI003A88AB95